MQARLPGEEGALVLAALEAGRDALREGRSSQSLAPESADHAGAGGEKRPTTDPDDSESASAETTHTGDSSRKDGVRADGGPSPAPPWRPPAGPVSNADALALMADTLLASGAAARTGGDSYQVVVHVDAAPLAEDKAGSCELEDGTALHSETARRLACDASLMRILERDGRPLSVRTATGASSFATTTG